ncbi:VTC domain-containing protein [Candidatus Magnetomoraceae bacterium gMMP-15]
MKDATRSNTQKEIPALLERYELKYLIPISMIEPISDYLSVYCSPDKYSLQSEDGFYKINSLYFDSPHFLFLRNRIQSAENRFNMRIRSYNSQSGNPCFFEIKQKKGGIARKYRGAVSDENWPEMFETPGYETPGSEQDRMINDRNLSNVRLFYQTALAYQAEPKVLTTYRRKAWVSDVDDYARATFDRDLCYQEAEGYNLIPNENRMIAYDNATVFDPDCSVILELKCYASQVPLWILDIISHFDLHRRAFSKYVNSVTEVIGLNVFNHLDRSPLSIKMLM